MCKVWIGKPEEKKKWVKVYKNSWLDFMCVLSMYVDICVRVCVSSVYVYLCVCEFV